MDAIFHRTSIRQFQDKPVEQEKMDLLLRAGLQAPSAVNQQPAEFYVVTDSEKREALSKATPYAGPAGRAPVSIVACYRKNIILPEYAHIDMAIATENIMLEADSLGLGSVMLGIAPMQDRMQIVREILDIPEELEVFTIIPVGYPLEVKPQQDRYEESRIHYVK